MSNSNSNIQVQVRPKQAIAPVSDSLFSSSPTSTFEWEKALSVFTPTCATFGIYGPSDTGKSTLALTAPDPIAYLYSNVEKDPGAVIAEAAAKGKTVYPWHFGGFSDNPDIYHRAHEYMRFWRELKARFKDSWRVARSIVIDTMDDAWILDCRAHFGYTSPDAKHATAGKGHPFSPDEKGLCIECGDKGKKGRRDANWAKPNDEWHTLFDLTKERQREGDKNKNLILVSKAKPIWKDNKKTSLFERKGQGDVGFYCDVEVVTNAWLDMQTTRKTFSSTIVKPWYNAFCQGREVDNWDGYNTFSGIMSFVTAEHGPSGEFIDFGDEEVWK